MIERFDEIFESLVKTNNSKSFITELYDILPFLNENELKAITLLKVISKKYNLEEYEEFIKDYENYKRRNKSLGLLNSFTKMLKYVSIEEKFRGYKINSTGGDNNNNM